MKKQTVFFLLFCLLTAFVWGQKTLIYLDHSDRLEFDKERWPDCQIVNGHVQFRHEDMIMFCDSAYFYDRTNYIVARGNIKMIQADTLFIYGDVLYYDGDAKLARLRHNVRMENKDATLYTDSLNYDRAKEVGYYFNGGRIIDKKDTLTSINGNYYPKEELAIFQYDVVLTNPDFVLTSDTLHYASKTKIATILGPSNIVYEDSTHIYSELGWYDTENNLAELTLNSHVNDLSGHRITADTLFHNHNTHLSEGFQNVQLNDSTQKIIITGGYGWYNDSLQSAMITQTPTLIQYDDKQESDSLFVAADSMWYLDNDSLKYIKAYYNVQAWKVDFQSICDSAYYNGMDSTLRLYGSPIMWNDSNQFTASEAIVYMANNEVERIELEADAFIFSKVDSTAINQVSGNNIVGYLKESKLYKADVSGNALSVYFIEEEPDSTQVDAPKEPSYVGINKAESSELFLYFTEDNKIKRLVMTPQSNGVLHSPKKAKDTKVTRLAGYQDYQSLRPTSKTDIYIPKKREALTAEEPAAKARKKRRNRD